MNQNERKKFKNLKFSIFRKKNVFSSFTLLNLDHCAFNNNILFIERKSCTVGMHRCVVIFFNFVKSKLILLDIINGLFYQTFRCFYTNPQAFSVRTSRQRHFLRNLSDNVLRSTDMWKCQKKNLVEMLASWSFFQGIWRGEYPFPQ